MKGRMFFATICFIFCFWSGQALAQQEVKIGVLVPMSGGMAVIG